MAPVPRFGLKREEAAKSIGVGCTFYVEPGEPEIRIVRRNNVRIAPVTELQRWLQHNAHLVDE